MMTAVYCTLWLAAVEPADERLLVCHFNGDLTGEVGEKPVTAEGIRFGTGRVGTRGLIVSKGTKLSYPTAGNLDVCEGTFCLWIRPSGWIGATDRQTRDILFMKASRSWQRDLFGLGKNRHYSVCFTITDRAGKHWQVYVKPSEVFAGDQWVHVAIGWRLHTGTMRLYVNGLRRKCLENDAPIALDRKPTVFSLGNCGGFPIDATIDELAVYARCLGDAQVLAEYRKPIAAYHRDDRRMATHGGSSE